MGGRWWRWGLVAACACALCLGNIPWQAGGGEALAGLRKLKSGMKRKGNRTRHQGRHPRRDYNTAYGNNHAGDRDAYVNPTARREYQLGKEQAIKSQARGNRKVGRGKGKASGKTSRARHYRR